MMKQESQKSRTTPLFANYPLFLLRLFSRILPLVTAYGSSPKRSNPRKSVKLWVRPETGNKDWCQCINHICNYWKRRSEVRFLPIEDLLLIFRDRTYGSIGHKYPLYVHTAQEFDSLQLPDEYHEHSGFATEQKNMGRGQLTSSRGHSVKLSAFSNRVARNA